MNNFIFNKNNIFEDLAIGVLASEKSRRMTTNKALLTIDGESFLSRICKEFDRFKHVYVSAGDKNSYKDFPVNVLCDAHHGVGPMEGIYQILKHSSCKYNFVCSVDMPFLKKELVLFLAKQVTDDYDCYVFKDEDRAQPTCAIYSKNLTGKIEGLILDKNYCLLEIYEICNTKFIDYPIEILDKKMITNINTLEDYEKLCKN